MEAASGIEQFLLSCRQEGEQQQEGEFTISREAALRKVAGFQLPFEDAWVVKIIQAIVADQNSSAVRIDLTKREVRFFFEGPSFTLDQVEQQFFDPQLKGSAALNHLMIALWSLGLHQKWAFHLALPGSAETLVWDGVRFHRRTAPEVRSAALLGVCHGLDQLGLLGWVGSNSNRLNANVTKVIAHLCFTSPIPINVNGVRHDSLLAAPSHGLSSSTLPIFLGFAEAELPALKIPQGTFGEVLAPPLSSALLGSDYEAPERKIKQFGQELIAEVAPRPEAPLAFLACGHFKWGLQGAGGLMNREFRSYVLRSSQLVTDQGHSYLFWVRDGAIVAQELLFPDKTFISVACFASAEGLQSDLTTFGLIQNREFYKRRSTVLDSLGKAVANPVPVAKHGRRFVNGGRARDLVLGLSLTGLGIFSNVVIPVFGLIFAGFGVHMLFTTGKLEKWQVGIIRGSFALVGSKLAERAAEDTQAQGYTNHTQTLVPPQEE